MKKIILVGLMILIMVTISSHNFSVLASNAGNVDVFGGISYLTGAGGTIGLKGGLEYDIVPQETSVLGDFTYYSPLYGHLFLFRLIGAYNLTSLLEEHYNIPDIKLTAGPVFFIASAPATTAINLDLQFSGVVEQEINNQISLRGEIQLLPGIISGMSGAVEISGGAVYNF